MPFSHAGLAALASTTTRLINASSLATGGPADMAQSVTPRSGKPNQDASEEKPDTELNLGQKYENSIYTPSCLDHILLTHIDPLKDIQFAENGTMGVCMSTKPRIKKSVSKTQMLCDCTSQSVTDATTERNRVNNHVRNTQMSFMHTTWCISKIKIPDTQFGFYPGRNTLQPMFILGHLQHAVRTIRPSISQAAYCLH